MAGGSGAALDGCLDYACRSQRGAGSLWGLRPMSVGTERRVHGSDPIADNPIACALVSSNDAAHMLRFLRNLKNHGFSPRTVITVPQNHCRNLATSEAPTVCLSLDL